MASGEIGDGLFMRGGKNHGAFTSVLQMKEGRAECFLAATLPPEFGGLDDGHEDFLRAGCVHLVADDVFDLAHGAQCHREVGIDAGGDLRDEAGADEEAMSRGVSIRRVIPQSLAEHLGHTHRSMVARGRDGEKSGAGRGATGFD